MQEEKKYHYTIRTLPVMRNEIKMYKRFLIERDKLIQEYITPLRELNFKLLEVEEKLTIIKSPGKGDGLGGYVQESSEKFNYLIQKKDDIRKEMTSYIQSNKFRFMSDVIEWKMRINTVEYYFTKMDAADRRFIEDFNYNLSKREVMDRYHIDHVNSLYRKSDNILKKLLGC